MISKLRALLGQIQSDPVHYDLGKYKKLLGQINALGPYLKSVNNAELKLKGEELKAKVRDEQPLNEILVEVFALVREIADRVLGMRPYDVQIMGGIALHEGNIIQMQTGEGKTLAAVAPALLNAFRGKGVHVLTFNDYLARRDSEWMRPVYEFLGLSVRFLQEKMDLHKRKQAYAADITYATTKEVGFDFLRDKLRYNQMDIVQRSFHYAIIDEADSLLIDEARIPLVISGNTAEIKTNLNYFISIVRKLKNGIDYDTDEYDRNIFLTDQGQNHVEEMLECDSLYDPENMHFLASLNLALHAEVLLKKDIDYIVRDGKIESVDEFTGRIVDKRRWPDGLQSALEAKEGLNPQEEGTRLGSITLQHFFRLYPKLCGMTGTAVPAADEFKQFYDLETVVVPTNRPCIRKDAPDALFTHRDAKERALIREIQQVHADKRPILVGTASVLESDRLALLLKQTNISCLVLNAKNDALEAEIIAKAGRPGAVTISTNMAGRGTDIILGPDSEKNRQKVIDLGGLYVIGTNRHESRRIDDQLRGRAGRQGDPGTTRFFISLDDDLITRFCVRDLLPQKYRNHHQETPINDPAVIENIAHVQRVIEGQNLEIRKTLWKYSSLMEKQRNIIHEIRHKILRGDGYTSLLAAESSDRWTRLCADFGEDLLKEVEQQITLYYIDRYWADHIAMASEIKKSIYLVSAGGTISIFGGIDPLEYFRHEVNTAYELLWENIRNDIITTFNKAEITANGIDSDKEGLRGPSSTWTFLINDNPYGEGLDKIIKNVKRLLRKR